MFRSKPFPTISSLAPPQKKDAPRSFVQDGIVAADCLVQWNQVELPRAVPTTLADPTKFRILWVGGVSKPLEIILRGSDGIWKHPSENTCSTFSSIP